jgi:predicted GNAT family N-acyltransferase
VALDVRIVTGDELSRLLALRERVFVREQGVPLELERDALEAAALHVGAFASGEVVGAARLRRLDAQTGKAERVCVAFERRGEGIGVALMACLEAEARERALAALVLSAQAPVIPFYERLGYRGQGPRFWEAGLEHLKMTKVLEARAPGDRARDRRPRRGT